MNEPQTESDVNGATFCADLDLEYRLNENISGNFETIKIVLNAEESLPAIFELSDKSPDIALTLLAFTFRESGDYVAASGYEEISYPFIPTQETVLLMHDLMTQRGKVYNLSQVEQEVGPTTRDSGKPLKVAASAIHVNDDRVRWSLRSSKAIPRLVGDQWVFSEGEKLAEVTLLLEPHPEHEGRYMIDSYVLDLNQ